VLLKTEQLRPNNELLLRFAPAEEVAKALEAKHGKVSDWKVWLILGIISLLNLTL
jgi:hypothetical protein